VTRIDAANAKVFSESREYSFDYLIVACGASHSYFGQDQWEDFAPGLKTVEQATEIRRRILSAFEEAEKLADPEQQRAYLTFVIVGGGPTGVELAGSIAELGRVTLTEDFRNIDPSRTRVMLIEAGPRILAAFDEKLSKEAVRDLEELGVQVWVNSRVTGITKDGVAVGKDFIASHTVLWAAGVATSFLAKQIPSDHDRTGRVEVQPDLSVPHLPKVFVIGDMASVKDQDGKPLPGLAPVAIQEGRHAARNILRDLRGHPRQPFFYHDKGMMATIGRKKAVLQARRFQMAGFLAWLAWLFVHVYYLIGFRNRAVVLLQWAWSYLTFKRGARLIVSHDWKSTSTSSTGP
jgi:NADH dehydrogenase